MNWEGQELACVIIVRKKIIYHSNVQNNFQKLQYMYMWQKSKKMISFYQNKK